MKFSSKSALSASLASLLKEATAITRQSLHSFFHRGGSLEVAFGRGFNQQIAGHLFGNFATGDFSAVPDIKILSSDQLGATNGAFSVSDNTIYLNRDFLLRNQKNPNAVSLVLLEEIGHFIDSQINKTRSEGDEGEIFARLVRGDHLSPEKLAALRSEDDHRQIMIDSKRIDVEQNAQAGVTIFGDSNYRGGSQFLGAGNYDIGSLAIGNDTLSSLRVSPGFAVVLYEHAGFTGASRLITSDTPWVGPFNDLTSSIQVVTNPLRVTNNNDSGVGSLRFAIDYASSHPGIDTIDLTGVRGVINLKSTLSISAGNNIIVEDDGNTIISGGSAVQVLSVYGANVTFSRLTIANGLARGADGVNGGGGGLGAGGALFINSGNVVLNNVTFTGNRAAGGNGGSSLRNGGYDGSGLAGGGGGGLNGGGGASGGGAGARSGNSGLNGGSGASGGFGVGGGAGGGGGGAARGSFGSDPSDNGGNGGGGGAGGFGAGGGAGGGGGDDYAYWSANEYGAGGAGGAGGQFGGNGSAGNDGSDRSSGRGGGGAGLGGAVFVDSQSSLTSFNTVFLGNVAEGGSGANNGEAQGRDLFVNNNATVKISGTDSMDRYGPASFLSNPQGYRQYSGSFYRLLESGSWEQAQAQAQSLGGNLVTINSPQEQDFLISEFGGSQQFWIGLADKATEGQFRWSSGENSSFTNWAPGQPDNYRGIEDYVSMNFGAAGQWNDSDGSGALRGIVENKFFEWNGSKYLLTGAATWEQAQAQAAAFGGNLVTINSSAERDYLVSTFGASESLWIGLTDKVAEGQFTWISGETSTDANWSPGQPDNAGNEDYVGMNFSGAGMWNDFPGSTSLRGIVEINQFKSIGNNGSKFFTLDRPANASISAIGGDANDIFQLRSYDGLTMSQQVYGGGGADIFNLSIQPASGIVGLDFNVGKLKQLAELLVTPDWDIREKRYMADIASAVTAAGIDYAAAAASAFAGALPYGSDAVEAGINVIATTAHLANDLANIELNYNYDLDEYQNSLADIGNFFDGQGRDGWGTVDVTQKRSLVEILDFEPGVDTILLPRLAANQSYTTRLATNSSGQTCVELSYNNQTNQASTFLRLGFSSDTLAKLNNQNIGITQFIESLLRVTPTQGSSGATHAAIGTSVKNGTAVSGLTYNGTMAGEHIYVRNTNKSKGVVSIYGNEGDDLLKGRTTGANALYGGAGDDYIVAGRVADYVDGGSGYDQLSYALSSTRVSLKVSSALNVESILGSKFDDRIDLTGMKTASADGMPYSIRGSQGNDGLVGSAFNDVITGGSGMDNLVGGAGDDVMTGGTGLGDGTVDTSNDVLTGGLGSDIFAFYRLGEGIDRIMDFDRLNDRIRIDKSGFQATSTSQFTYDNLNGALAFNGQQFATLVNLPAGFSLTSNLVLA